MLSYFVVIVKSSRSDTASSAKSSGRDSKSASDTMSMNGSTKGSKKQKKKKDFIKRNKEVKTYFFYNKL